MTPGAAPFLEAMKQAAERAAAAEDAFRRDYTARIAALEHDRAHAFRRLNLMRSLSETIAAADTEAAVASALAALRDRLGWSSDTEARTTTLEHFKPVISAMATAIAPKDAQPAPDVAAALAEFEAWYAAAHGSAFWVLFEHYMPETPRVDF